jgi:hypothetical protein
MPEMVIPPKSSCCYWVSFDEDDFRDSQEGEEILTTCGDRVVRKFPNVEMKTLFLYMFMALNVPTAYGEMYAKIDPQIASAIYFDFVLSSTVRALAFVALAYLIWVVASLLLKMEGGCAALWHEYQNVKVVAQTEYASFKQYTVAELVDIKESYRKNMIAQLAIGTLGTVLIPTVGALFWGFFTMWKWNNKGKMYTQGFRSDANRLGMGVTGLLSIPMILLSPIYGAKRIGNLLRPVLDVLRQLPAATWMMDWIAKWFNGDVEFEDLPETAEALRKEMDDLSNNEHVQSTLDEYTKMAQKFKPKSSAPPQEAKPLNREYTAEEKEVLEKACQANADEKYEFDMKELMERALNYFDGLEPVKQSEELEALEDLVEQGISRINTRLGLGKCKTDKWEEITLARLQKMRKRVMAAYEPKGHADLPKKYKQAFVSSKAVITEADLGEPMCATGESAGLEYPLAKQAKIGSSSSSNDGDLSVVGNSDDSSATGESSDETDIKIEEVSDPETASSSDESSIHVRLIKEPVDVPEGWELDYAVAEEVMIQARSERGFRGQVSAFYNMVTNVADGVLISGLEFVNDNIWELRVPVSAETKQKIRQCADHLGEHNNRTPMGAFCNTMRFQNEEERRSTIIAMYAIAIKKFLRGAAIGMTIIVALAAAQNLTHRETYEPLAQHSRKKRRNEDHGNRRGKKTERKAGTPNMQNADGENLVNSSGVELEGSTKEPRQDDHRENEHGYSSSGTEDSISSYSYSQDEDSIEYDHPSAQAWGYEPSNGSYYVFKQGHYVPLAKLPVLKADDKQRRAIYKSKHRNVWVSPDDKKQFINQAKSAFQKAKSMQLKQQSFKPLSLAAGVYKFFVDDRYACTATHVSNRLYVVLHCLSEHSGKVYKAVNHANTLLLNGSDLVVVTKEIGYFPVNGIPSPFKTKDFKVLDNATIVSIFGFGSGVHPEPELKTGFASPLGWCNAGTEIGDCSSPVLNLDGKIVGFWTHGDGKGFGRFDQITEAFLEQARSDNNAKHAGLVFQSSPPCQLNC